MTEQIELNASVLIDAVRTAPVGRMSGWRTGQTFPKWSDLSDVKVEGFEFLGMGCSRIAYLKDGLVYKIEYSPIHPDGMDRLYANESEYDTWCMFQEKGLPFGWKVPDTDLIWVQDQPVIIMDHIIGEFMESDEDWALCDQFCEETGMVDIGADNAIRTADGSLYAIDICAA